MSRRTTAANRRRRQAPAARRAPAPPARASSSKARLDPIAEYARAPGHGRTMRIALLIGLCLIGLYQLGSLDNGTPRAELASVGASIVIVFYLLSVVNYFRVLYRVRRHSPESWKPGFRFMTRMLGAPLGVGDPRATSFDRTVLRLTALAAAAVVVLTLIPKH